MYFYMNYTSPSPLSIIHYSRFSRSKQRRSRCFLSDRRSFSGKLKKGILARGCQKQIVGVCTLESVHKVANAEDEQFLSQVVAWRVGNTLLALNGMYVVWHVSDVRFVNRFILDSKFMHGLPDKTNAVSLEGLIVGQTGQVGSGRLKS